MDPNKPIGPPREPWIWLAPDWSDYVEAEKAPAGKTGWTRVKIRETIYNDGRIVRHVLDANGNPVAEGGAPATADAPARPLDSTPQYDPDQEKRWKEQQDDAKPPGGIPTRTINGQVFNWNPTTRAYDIPTGEAPAPATTTAQKPVRVETEGTPDPSKPDGFDNERPRRASYWPDGRITYEPLTPAEMKEWRESRERSRNPGGKTDAEIAAEKKDADAKAEADRKAADTTVVDISYSGTGKNRKKVTTYKSGRKATEDAPTNATAIKTERDPNTGQTRVTYDDGTVTTEDPKPNERPVSPALPPELANWQPDRNKPAYGTAELIQTIQRLRAEGKLAGVTDQQIADFVTNARATATAVANQEQAVINNAQTAYTNAVNARNQQAAEQTGRSTLANSIVSNAQTQAKDISLMAKPGSGSAVAPLVSQGLAMQAAGYKHLPEVQLPPAIRTAYERSMNNGQPAPPNAIGVGSTGSVVTPNPVSSDPRGILPTDGPLPPVTPPPMSREYAMANPVFRPAPMPPGSAVVPPPVNPMPGQPGSDPTRPIGALPPMIQGSFLANDPVAAMLKRIGMPDDQIMAGLGMG